MLLTLSSNTTPNPSDSFSFNILGDKWQESWLTASQNTVGDELNFKDDKTEQETVFEKLLLSFYCRTWTIQNVSQFTTMVEFADYYRALPTFSTALSGALLDSRWFTQKLVDDQWN
jgi:hypothetical protein